MTTLRKYIRSVLNESSFGSSPPQDLPDEKIWSLLGRVKDPRLHIKMANAGDGYIKLFDGKEELVVIDFLYAKTSHLRKSKYKTVFGPCSNAYMVKWAKAKVPGFGPICYDALLEWVYLIGGHGLVNDRYEVSGAAQEVWSKYLSMRPDVETFQLDLPGSPLTDDPEDDCADVMSAEHWSMQQPGGKDIGVENAYPEAQELYGPQDDIYDLYDDFADHQDRVLKNMEDPMAPSSKYLKYIQDSGNVFSKVYYKKNPRLLTWFLKNNRIKFMSPFAKSKKEFLKAILLRE